MPVFPASSRTNKPIFSVITINSSPQCERKCHVSQLLREAGHEKIFVFAFILIKNKNIYGNILLLMSLLVS